jgi:AcrR family transcriptional regulator
MRTGATMPGRAGPEGGRRMSAAARREQLLDAAAALVVGGESLTMEGLAAAAGVSKALPYRHFGNADEVLAALHDRELARLAARVRAALEPDGAADERLAAGVHAFFDVVAERGVLLGILGRRLQEGGDADRRGPRFVAGLLADLYGLPPRRAEVVGEVLLGALLGAVQAWACGAASRRLAEDAAVRSATAIARSAATGAADTD